MNNHFKIFKISVFLLTFAVCFCLANISAASQGQFPDALKLQPLPLGVYPGAKGGINENDVNSGNNNGSGNVSPALGQVASGQGGLDPNTSYVDTTDHLLFVVDTGNNRVLVFELNSDNILVDSNPDYVLGQSNFTTFTSGATQSKLNGPGGIAYDPESHELFVADTNNNRIMVFDVSSIRNGENAVNVIGQPDFTASAPGATLSELNNPDRLAYDANAGQLFVADTNNNRVMVFGATSISNGENAVNAIARGEDSSTSPLISNNPKNNSKTSGGKNIFYKSTLFWLAALIIAALVVAAFIYFMKKWYNK